MYFRYLLSVFGIGFKSSVIGSVLTYRTALMLQCCVCLSSVAVCRL